MIHFSRGPQVYMRNAADLERFGPGDKLQVYRRGVPISADTVKVVEVHPRTAALVIDDPAGLWAEMRRGDELRRCE